MIKVTLFSPDGSTEVFTECQIEYEMPPELIFTGKDAWGNTVKRLTTRQYDIDPNALSTDALLKRME